MKKKQSITIVLGTFFLACLCFSFAFGQASGSYPSIVSYLPARNATDVSTSTAISITFQNTIVKRNGTILIKESANNTLFDSIPVMGDRTILSGGNVLTFLLSPSVSFVGGKSYYIELPYGIVADSDGNLFSGLVGISGWRFTIEDKNPPFISNMAVTPDKNGAMLLWNTNEPSVYSYFWGTTNAYEAGTGSDTAFSTAHRVTLSPVLRSTTYYYKIESKDSAGNISSFTGTFAIDSEVDTIPPGDPSNFKAVIGAEDITLTWKNPSDLDFAFVKIVRSKTTYPVSSDDGDVVYEGNAQKTIDRHAEIGVKYYYAIFSKDTWENYSSGSFATAKIPVSIAPVVAPTPIPTPKPVSSTTSPLIKLPVASSTTPTIAPAKLPGTPTTTTPLLVPKSSSTVSAITEIPEIATTTPSNQSLLLSDFEFFEQGRNETKIDFSGGTIFTDSNKEIRVIVSSTKLPPEEKSVVLKIQNLKKEGEVSSFAFVKKNSGKEKDAVINLDGASGSFNFGIEIFGSNGKLLTNTAGVFVLGPKPVPLVITDILPIAVVDRVVVATEKITPTALPFGIAMGVSQSAVLVTNIGSFFDVYLVILRALGVMFGVFRRKKPKSWGVVYDSVTKRPIDPAYVVMEDLKGEKKNKSAITDLDGRYGFLAEPGAYSINVNKTHYQFPSQITAGKIHDEMYDDLYFGGIFETDEYKVIQYNIPLDPIGFDWNEFIKNKEHIFNLYSRKEKIRAFVFGFLFVAGFSLSVVSVIFTPSVVNFIFFVSYIIITAFQMIWKREHKVTVLIGKDGKPISFAIISAEISGLSIPIVKKVTTDILGRFYLLTQPGVYDIKIQEKQPDGSYLEIYRAPGVEFKKGVLTEDIIVSQ